MARNPQASGQKWQNAYQDATSDASASYAAVLPGLADQVIAKKADAKAAFAAALDSPNFDNAVRQGLAVGKADIAYAQKGAQIAITGFTDSQRQKLIDQTILRRHLSTLLPAIITAATGQTGKLTFPDGLADTIKRMILSQALMKYVDSFTTATTATAAENVLIANIADIDGLTVS